MLPTFLFRAVEDFQKLIQQVENGHAYATVNCVAFSPEELEVIREFDMESETGLQNQLADFEGGHFRRLGKEEWPAALGQCFQEAFDFSVKFSSKKEEAKKMNRT